MLKKSNSNESLIHLLKNNDNTISTKLSKTVIMATRIQIKQKLQRALTFEIKKVNKALVNNKMQSDIEITDVIFIEPKIIIPEDIDKDDFEKATEIDFEWTPIRLNKAGESSIHYCNGNANVVYENNEFNVNLNIYSIKSR